jgi:hypothetical protein
VLIETAEGLPRQTTAIITNTGMKQAKTSLVGFLSAFGITPKESRSFVPELDESSGLLVVRLEAE